MDRRILKILGGLAVVWVALCVGVIVVGGGIVYAMARNSASDAVTFTFPSDAEEWFESEPGIVIAAVLPDGPAGEAGVERGDILLAVDGEAVDDLVELMHILTEHEEGDEVELTVLHGDDERALTATLGERDGGAYLGVVPCAGMPIPEWRGTIHTAAPGTVIVDVTPESPADQAGLEEGDVIVAVAGQELDEENSLADVIAVYEPGDTVTLEVERPGEESRDVTVELGEHPEKEGVAYLGVRYGPSFHRLHIEEEGWLPHLEGPRVPFPPGDFSFHMIPDGEMGDVTVQGAIVHYVEEDSPAAAAGLNEHDLITAIEGEPVEKPGDLVDAIAERKPGDRVTLTISRPGEEDEEREVEVTLGEHPDEESKAYLGVYILGFFRMHRHSDGGEGAHELEKEFELQLEGPFDDEHLFDLEIIPEHFEFHFPPDHFDDGDCCGESI
jgi:S1-C subfamily serine protease